MTAERPGRRDAGSASELLEHVEALRRERPREARELLLGAFSRAARRATPRERAELWRTRGHVLRDTNSMPSAAAAYRRARQAFRRAGDPREAATCTHGLLDALMYAGEYEEALRAAAQGVRELRRLGDTRGAARLLNNQANLLHRLDRPARALALYDEARRILARDPFSRSVVDVNMANCLSSVGRSGPARRKYGAAVRVFTAGGHTLRALNARYNFAYLDYLEHRHERALAGMADIRSEATTMGAASLVALAALDRAEILLRLGADFEAAAESREALGALGALDLRYETAKAHVLAALADFHLGRIASARAQLEAALADFTTERNDVWIGESLVGLATLWRHEGAPDSAAVLLTVARGRFQRAGDGERAACAAAFLARMQLETGCAPQAARTLRTLRAAAATGSPRLRQFIWAAEAHLAVYRGDRAGARRWLQRAARESERLAARILDEQWRASFWGEWGWPHRALAWLEISAGRLDKAFDALERGRGRALFGPLQERPARDSKAVDALREWAATARGNDRTVRSHALSVAAPARPPAAAKSSLPLRLHARPAPGPSARELRRALGREVVLLDYLAYDGWFGALQIAEAGVAARPRLASERHIAGLVDAIVFELRSAALSPRGERRLSTALRDALTELASLVLWPFWRAGADGARARIALLPAGILGRVPWPALPLPDGSMLCEAADIAIVPGLRLARAASAGRAAPAGSPLLVTSAAGDPDCAAEESAALAALFPAARRLDAGEATLAQVREASRHAAWIHVAGHGSFHAAAPGDSGLHLADGWLTLRALRGFRTDAAWVALSACQTARALVRPGEEWYGLAPGFLAAGANCVLAAQWDVEGQPTAHLMTQIYRHIAGGQPLTRAVGLTQAAAARAGTHPIEWAAFSVLGAAPEMISWTGLGRTR